MEKDSYIMESGLKKIKETMSNDENKKKLLIASIAPLAIAAIGGGLLLRKRLNRPPQWDSNSFVDEVTKNIMKGVRS